MIYFLQARGGGPIKIGYTRRTAQDRQRELQPGSPDELVIVAEASGDGATEKRLHMRFASAKLAVVPCKRRGHRICAGEWFTPVPALMELVHALHDGIDLAAYLEAS